MLSMHVLTFWRQRKKSQGEDEEEKEGGEVLAWKEGRSRALSSSVFRVRSFSLAASRPPVHTLPQLALLRRLVYIPTIRVHARDALFLCCQINKKKSQPVWFIWCTMGGWVCRVLVPQRIVSASGRCTRNAGNGYAIRLS